ncbi:MAG: ABC transporter ATP-binding protein [Planctomycetota bacterium]
MKSTRMRAVLLLLRCLKPYKFPIIMGALAMVGTDLLQLTIPKLIGEATDQVMHSAERGGHPMAVSLVLDFCLVVLALQMVRYGWRHYLVGSARRMGARLKEDFLSHIQNLGLEDYHRMMTGDLMSRATSDINAVVHMVAFGFGVGLDVTIHVFMGAGILWRLDSELLKQCILPTLLTPVVFHLVSPRIHKASKTLQELSSRLAALAQETFAGIHVVKAFANEPVNAGRFESESGAYAGQVLKVVKLNNCLSPVVRFLVSLSLLLALLFGAPRLVSGTLTAGEMVSFFQYLTMMSWSLFATGFVVSVFQQGMASLERLEEIFACPPAAPPGGHSPPDLDTSMEVRNLTFAYRGGERVLRDISFKVPAGSRVGIVGPVGAGKSTLLSLLARLYDPPRGSVFMGGVDILDLDPSFLRKRMGFVPQEPFLFSDTVEENTALALAGPDSSKVGEALEISCIAEEVAGFYSGRESILGEKGVNVSGGQKQRLTLARALVHAPLIMVFDDCLSALDAETEEKVVEGLKKQGGGRTQLIAAHRMSAVQDCDLILVLEGGMVVDRGTHAQLMARPGYYRLMVERQSLELSS